MTDPRIAALAEALHQYTCFDHPDGTHIPPLCATRAAAILAALDGWDLVRVDDLGRQIVGLYMVERDEAIARLRKIEEATRDGHFAFCDATDKREPCGLSTCSACTLRAALEAER